MPELLVGSPQTVANTYTTASQHDPVAVALEGGGYALFWTSIGQDGSVGGIFGQLFDASGDKVGAEFQVNTTTAGSQFNPVVGKLDDGGFVVAWISNETPSNHYSRAFSAAGEPVGAETAIDHAAYQFWHDTERLDDGGYLRFVHQPGPFLTVERHAASGDLLWSQTVWNSSAVFGDMVELAGGGYAATFAAHLTPGSFQLYVRLLGEDGSLGALIPYETTSGGGDAVSATSIVALDDGGFVVTGAGGLAYRYDEAGALVGTTDLRQSGEAFAPVLVELENGFATAWTARLEPGAPLDVATRAFSLFIGTEAGEVITGSEDDDKLEGRGGNDALFGLGGADLLVGGLGDDWYYVDGEDTIIEAADEGWDNIWTSISYTAPDNVEHVYLAGDAAINATGNELGNFLRGNEASNQLVGLGGSDILYGLGGNDFLSGGDGLDEMVGGLGDDWYVVDQHGDTVVEAAGEGLDNVVASVFYVAPDNVENVYLSGDDDIDAVGNDLANQLRGNDQNNVLWGHGGDDMLVGEGGNDGLVGGEGADGFVFSGAFGSDQVFDFSAGDILWFSRDLFDLPPGSSEADYDVAVLARAEALEGSEGDTVITFGENRIILNDVAVGELTGDMFGFF